MRQEEQRHDETTRRLAKPLACERRSKQRTKMKIEVTIFVENPRCVIHQVASGLKVN